MAAGLLFGRVPKQRGAGGRPGALHQRLKTRLRRWEERRRLAPACRARRCCCGGLWPLPALVAAAAGLALLQAAFFAGRARRAAGELLYRGVARAELEPPHPAWPPLHPYSQRANAAYTGGTRIPRILHQTFSARAAVPRQLRRMARTWQALNPAWETRFYDNADCRAFVEREFPEYLAAYLALPKDVERSDFFRYLVLLRHGGAYADMDTEAKQPLDRHIQAGDTLVVGWENEFPSARAARARSYARTRQVLQWIIIAAPGHPVLRAMCDFVARHATDDAAGEDTDRATLERTGPGAWTDQVLAHVQRLVAEAEAAGPGGGELGRAWPVRILPKVALGADPKGRDGVAPGGQLPGVVALHWFKGTWKHSRRCFALPRALRTAFGGLPFLGGASRCPAERPPRADGGGEQAPAGAEEEARLDGVLGGARGAYPVSVNFFPPFTLLVNLAGQDGPDAEGRPERDFSRAVSTWGMWPGGQVPLVPSVPEAALGFLAPARAGRGEGEGEGEGSEGPEHPGEQPQRVVGGDGGGTGDGGGEVAVVDVGGEVAVVDVGAGKGLFALAAAARGLAAVAVDAPGRDLALLRRSAALNGPAFVARVDARAALLSDAEAAAEAGGGEGSTACASRAHLRRWWAARAGPEEDAGAGAGPCEGAVAVSTVDGEVARAGVGVAVGGLRVMAFGGELRVLRGARRLLQGRAPPAFVLLELALDPEAEAEDGEALSDVLRQMREWGYADGLHTGPACARRRAGGAPGWCRLADADATAGEWGGESLLLVHGAVRAGVRGHGARAWLLHLEALAH